MSGKSQTIQQATIGIALLVLISKGIGFFREVIIAYRFGTGIEYDTYLIAVSIPIALFSLFGYTFTNLFIPRYSQATTGDEKKTGYILLWRDFNLSFLASLLIVVCIIVFAAPIIRLIAPGLKDQYISEAVFMVRVSSVIVVLAMLEAFFRSILNAEKQFILPAAGPVLANLVLILFIVSFSGSISARAILYGLVVGFLFQVLLIAIPFRRLKIVGFFQSRFFHKHSIKFVTTATIILIVEGASQVYAIVDRYFASSMEAGIVSALGYAYLLMMLPVAIFAYALSTALFPYITDAVTRGDMERSAHLLARGINVSLLLALPTTMIIWVFSEKIVLLLFRRGAFDMQSVTYTSLLLKYLALGLAGTFIIWIMSRLYYAARKYGILIAYVIVALGTKIVIAVFAVKSFGYIGLAIAGSVSYTAGAVLLVLFAGHILTRIDARGILVYVIKVIFSTAAGFLTAHIMYTMLAAGWNSFGQLLIGLPIAIGVSLLAVLITGYGVNIPDIRNLPAMVRRRTRTSDDPN